MAREFKSEATMVELPRNDRDRPTSVQKGARTSIAAKLGKIIPSRIRPRSRSMSATTTSTETAGPRTASRVVTSSASGRSTRRWEN